MTWFLNPRFAAAVIGAAVMASCTSDPSALHGVTADYFSEYAARSDVDALLDYHADSVELRDYVAGERVRGIDALQEFFDWSNPSYRMRDSVALVVDDILVESHRAVVTGYFTPFSWDGVPVEAMHFTTLLTFDAEQRIALQEDWINYPSGLLDYGSRSNSNDWIGGASPGSSR